MQVRSTFFSGHFLFARCTPNGLVPAIVSDDLYQSLNCSSCKLHGYVPKSANNPVEVTLLTMSLYSSQSLGITSLRDISWKTGSEEAEKNCLKISLPGVLKGVMSLLIKSAEVSTGSS